MTEAANSPESGAAGRDGQHEGRERASMDVDRMVNEGLGGGQVTIGNGLIDATTTDEMEDERI